MSSVNFLFIICFVTFIASDPPKVGITFNVLVLLAIVVQYIFMVFNFLNIFLASKYYFMFLLAFLDTIFGNVQINVNGVERERVKDFGHWHCNGFCVCAKKKKEITCKINHFWKWSARKVITDAVLVEMIMFHFCPFGQCR